MHNEALRDMSIGGLVRQDHLLYGFILAYTACAVSIGFKTGQPVGEIFALYVTPWSVTFGFLFPVLYFSAWGMRGLWLARTREPGDNSLFLARVCAGMALALAMVLFQASFTVIKNALPAFNGGGFPLDTLHADIDRMLHGGIDPWRFFEPLIASRPALQAMELNYGLLWFLFNYGFLFVVLVSPGLSHLRRRYFYAFALTWILVGNVFAGMFLSAGPAFYGAVTGDGQRFADLAALLGTHLEGSHSAATYQNYLWTMHASGNSGLGSGISAFPSVHVALTVINMLFAFEIRRWLGIAMAVYAAIIFASSVALGWHYAIDGYASFAICAVLYWALRKVPELDGENAKLHQVPAAAS